MNDSSATDAVRPSTVILSCPECGELGESDAQLRDLTCPECAHQWQKAPVRTADETIALLRALLHGSQDATRRAFYNPNQLLRMIATAIDAYPDPPLAAPEARCRIRLSWGCIVGSGMAGTATGVHYDETVTPRRAWVGSVAEAVEIIRTQYPPSRGTDTQIVIVNSKELVG